MEGIATRMFRDLKHLEDEIRTVIPPKASWPEYEGLREGMAKDPCDKKIFDDIQLSLSEGFQKTQGNGVLLDLSEKPTKDYHALIQLCHKMTKDQGGEIPKVVFMGGNASKTYLAVFTRPLVTQDFLRLWSIGSEENGKGKEAIE
ncbi:MAG: hypothetical protein EHM36_02450 [Deltaproteobacteria bacterium]|nr:MAG: hypothetical protein EHM36_02450 [Deltaproteobacteria bacterium]